MTKFTPGPWHVEHGSHGAQGIFIWRNDGNEENTGHARICRNVRSDADARLIAAAPEMYGALIDALIMFEYTQFRNSTQKIIGPAAHFHHFSHKRRQIMRPYRKPNTETKHDSDIETFSIVHEKASEFVAHVYAELDKLNFHYKFSDSETLLQSILDSMYDCNIPSADAVADLVAEAEREYVCEAEATWADMDRDERWDRSLGL